MLYITQRANRGVGDWLAAFRVAYMDTRWGSGLVRPEEKQQEAKAMVMVKN